LPAQFSIEKVAFEFGFTIEINWSLHSEQSDRSAPEVLVHHVKTQHTFSLIACSESHTSQPFKETNVTVMEIILIFMFAIYYDLRSFVQTYLWQRNRNIIT